MSNRSNAGYGKRKAKPIQPRVANHWLSWCPICTRRGKVIGVAGFRVGKVKTIRRWACETCVKEHCLIPAPYSSRDATAGVSLAERGVVPE